jgi:TRAP-type C4-dicarboxylate transport system permease small subunit
MEEPLTAASGGIIGVILLVAVVLAVVFFLRRVWRRWKCDQRVTRAERSITS